VVAGPAPRPLDRYQTRLNGSKLLLGKLQEAPPPEKKS
jgi:Rieske Fe-S protein